MSEFKIFRGFPDEKKESGDNIFNVTAHGKIYPSDDKPIGKSEQETSKVPPRPDEFYNNTNRMVENPCKCGVVYRRFIVYNDIKYLVCRCGMIELHNVY